LTLVNCDVFCLMCKCLKFAAFCCLWCMAISHICPS
jgi:hypothetical protein